MEKNTNLGVVISWLSIVLNIILFAIKLWVGLLFRSVALIADAWHTLADSVSSLAVLIGIKVAQKPADEEHPFGHGRAEIISTIVVGLLLAIVGFNFTLESIIKLRAHESVEYGSAAIWVTLISIVVKEVMAQYSIRYGKKIKASSIIADGWHHRSDALSSVLILIGIIFGDQFWWMDGALGLFVSAFIFYTTYSILKESISVFLGERIDDDLKKQILTLGKNLFVEGVDAHHFLLHQYGNHAELTFHISLPGSLSLLEAHQIATEFEQRIANQLNISTTIHIDSIDDK